MDIPHVTCGWTFQLFAVWGYYEWDSGFNSLVAQTVISLPAMWEIWVQSLGQEDPLEKEMATHSSLVAWRIPWTEEPGRLQSMGSQRVRHDRATNTHTRKVHVAATEVSYKIVLLSWKDPLCFTLFNHFLLPLNLWQLLQFYFSRL